MANVQLAVAGDETTQVILSVPGVQGPAGSNLPPSGTTNQVLYKQSSTDYDTAWSLVTSAMITDGTIVNGDINASAAIAGTKISPDFGSQNVVTTGTATAASFIPTSSGVPANGLYLPSANNVAISTGGSGRLFVASDGKIGIGSSGSGTQSARTFIEGSGACPLEIDATAGSGGYLTLSNSGSAKAFFGFGSNIGTASVNDIAIRSQSGALAFQTGGANERLRITSAGLVGVGTSGPSVRFQVQDSIAGGSDGTVATLHNVSDTGADTRYVGLNFRIGSDNGTSAIRAYRTNSANNYETNLSFWTNPAGATQTPLRAMTIDSYQRVGIGTTSVDAILHTSQTTTGIGTGLILENKATSGNLTNCQALWKAYDGSSVAIIGGVSALSSSWSFGTYTANSFNILSLKSGGIHLRAPNAPIVFSNNGSDIDNVGERARIDSSGRLLVGTSSARSNFFNTTNITPGVQIEQTGNGGALAIVRQSADTGGAFIALSKSRGTSVGSNTLPADGDDLGAVAFLGSDGSEFVAGAIIAAQVDGTPAYAATALVNGQTYRIVTVGTTDFTLIGASANTVGTVFTATGPGTGTGTAILNAGNMPGRLVFSTTADGASSPTERMRITSDAYVRLASGTGGVQFNGDTAAANALDDYEEGTWTPSVGGTATYSDQTGFYTKIGRTVIASFKFSITTLGTGSAFNVSGIPFATSDVGRGGVYFYYWINLAQNTVTLAGLLGTNSFDITGQDLAAAGIDYQKPVLGDGTRVDGMLVYQVT